MKKWFLVLVIFVGFFLRVANLSSHPAGFTPDEASFGYDAYSILKTGKDQWGNSFPLVFKSFGDDKLPLYGYLTVPSVFLFGLSEFSVRLPNALIGGLAIIVTYFLVKKLFKNESLAIFSSFLLAISPWHIMLSRGAFEANLTTFLLPFGILLFLNGLKNPKYLVFSAIVFGLNLFSYHTARILTPLIVGFLVWQNWQGIKSKFLLFFVVFGIFLLVAIYFYFMAGGRIGSSAIFDLGFADDRYLAQAAGEPGLIAKFFYNRPVYVLRQFLTNYLSYFSPQFLVVSGPAEATYGMVPGVGVIYFIEAVFLIGFIWMISKGVEKNWLKSLELLLFWVFISPIPASLTKGPGFAANRVEFVLPALQIILSLGAFFVFQKLKQNLASKLLIVSYLVISLFSFSFVLEKYLITQKVNYSKAMLFGMGDLVRFFSEVKDEGQKVIVSKTISEPHIYFAFYEKIDPFLFQKETQNWSLVNGWVDQMNEYQLGKYTFKSIDKIADFRKKGVLLVGKPEDFPVDSQILQKISTPDFKDAYWVIDPAKQ